MCALAEVIYAHAQGLPNTNNRPIKMCTFLFFYPSKL